MTKTKTIKCEKLLDEQRTYTFNLMNQETGGRLFHEHAALILHYYDSIFTAMKESKESGTQFLGMLHVASEVLTWNVVERFAKDMLPEYSLNINDGPEQLANKQGFLECSGDPLGIYHAIYQAILANYEKYIDPLKELLTADDDSIPEK